MTTAGDVGRLLPGSRLRKGRRRDLRRRACDAVAGAIVPWKAAAGWHVPGWLRRAVLRLRTVLQSVQRLCRQGAGFSDGTDVVTG